MTVGTRHYQIRQLAAGQRHLSSFYCFEQGTPAGGCHDVRLQQQPRRQNLQRHRVRIQEPRQSDLARHAGRHGVLHVVAGLPSRRLQPDRRRAAHHRRRMAVPQYVVPKSYQSDKSDQQRDRLEDGISGSSPAVERRGLPGELERRADRVLQSRRQYGNLVSDTNGQNFRVRGIETSLVARVDERAHVAGRGVLEPERADEFAGADRHQSGERRTSASRSRSSAAATSRLNCTPISNPFGPVGAPSANSPPIQFSLRARYEWTLATTTGSFRPARPTRAFVHAGGRESFHSPGGAINTSRGRFELPAYSIYNASFGVAKDAWTVSVFCENLSNSNASTFISTDQFVVEQTLLRPRVIGGSFGYKF